MKTQNFTCTITADCGSQAAQKNISQVSAWWAKDFEGKSEKLNDVFTVRFGETFVTFKVTHLSENKVVWLVTDCYLHWLNNKTEWTNTELFWDLSEKSGKTEIRFTHAGLVPAIECYGDCSKGWTQHITGSLAKLMAEGKGVPA